jgi:hypothetical protein
MQFVFVWSNERLWGFPPSARIQGLVNAALEGSRYITNQTVFLLSFAFLAGLKHMPLCPVRHGVQYHNFGAALGKSSDSS